MQFVFQTTVYEVKATMLPPQKLPMQQMRYVEPHCMQAYIMKEKRKVVFELDDEDFCFGITYCVDALPELSIHALLKLENINVSIAYLSDVTIQSFSLNEETLSTSKLVNLSADTDLALISFHQDTLIQHDARDIFHDLVQDMFCN